MYKQDLALNNSQGLIYYKTKPNQIELTEFTKRKIVNLKILIPQNNFFYDCVNIFLPQNLFF